MLAEQNIFLNPDPEQVGGDDGPAERGVENQADLVKRQKQKLQEMPA
jgi:hypothetical protein